MHVLNLIEMVLEALQMLVIPLHQDAVFLDQSMGRCNFYVHLFFSVNISVNSTISSRLLTGLLLLVSLMSKSTR